MLPHERLPARGTKGLDRDLSWYAMRDHQGLLTYRARFPRAKKAG